MSTSQPCQKNSSAEPLSTVLLLNKLLLNKLLLAPRPPRPLDPLVSAPKSALVGELTERCSWKQTGRRSSPSGIYLDIGRKATSVLPQYQYERHEISALPEAMARCLLQPEPHTIRTHVIRTHATPQPDRNGARRTVKIAIARTAHCAQSS